VKNKTKAQEVIKHIESLRDDMQRENLMRFFKTGSGEYGEGDEFLGLKVPQTREVVKMAGPDFPLEEVPELLMNRWHEVRLCGFLILVAKFEKLATKRLERSTSGRLQGKNDAEAIKQRDEIVTMYLQYAEQANNWDLVDLSAHKILGHWLLLPSNLGDRDYKIKVLDDLAASPCLWKQRMSIVCSWKTSQQGATFRNYLNNRSQAEERAPFTSFADNTPCDELSASVVTTPAGFWEKLNRMLITNKLG